VLLFSRKRAKQILDDGAAKKDESKLQETLSKRQRIIDRVLGTATLAPYIDQVKLLFNMLQDYAKGNYREVPWWSIGSIATALLYILTPLDAIPDFLPVAGFLDDAVVLKLCLDLVVKDLDQYRLFRSNNGAQQELQDAAAVQEDFVTPQEDLDTKCDRSTEDKPR
jgi:uncharacterized membrane protein YkvA (DUF1232 family)